MPLLCLLHPDGGTQLRRVWLLVVREKQPVEDIQIDCDRLHVDVFIVDFFDVVFQRPIGRGRALVAGQGPQQQTDLPAVAFGLIDTVHIVVDNGIQILTGQQRDICVVDIQISGPAAAHCQTGERAKIDFTRDGRSKLSFAELMQADLAAGIPGLIERHGAHPQLSDTPGSAVEHAFPLRCGRAGQNKLAFFAPLIHSIAHRIPKRGNFLPFVDQTRRLSLQHQGGGHFRQRSVLKVVVRVADQKLTVAVIGRSPCLPAPLWPLYTNSTHCGKIPFHCGVNNTGNVFLLVHDLIHLHHLLCRQHTTIRLILQLQPESF